MIAAAHHGRPFAFLARLMRDEKASTAMEFAIAAPFLIGILMATFEIIILFLAQAALETTAEGAARYVLTGQAQTNFTGVKDSNGKVITTPQQQFAAYVCTQMSSFMSCNNLYVDVNSGSDYTTVDLSVPQFTFDATNNYKVTNTFNYNPGTQGQIVAVRLFYIWSVTSIFGFNIADSTLTLPGAHRILIATSVSKTEVYTS
ncbi:TadE-like protein [Novosphingobium nitrogenifigens DSM 19370]|uniref:TadE-like protein n=2 Tax=Novosphingobium nitrogenifigens TaxID=378548 RepID=F1Z4A9_9SPHN|nr:TadE-like protein [Novosphingobium nitrogenifigens DSM 19370]